MPASNMLAALNPESLFHERRWRARLPEALRRAGSPGSVTCLFWPTAHAGAQEAAAKGSHHVGIWARVRQWPAIRPIRLAIQVRCADAATLTNVGDTLV